MTKENNKMFFVIRKDKWPAGNIKYTIMKDKPFTLTDATRMLLAYEQINDDKDHTYHLNSVDEYLEAPKETLVLTKDDNIGFDNSSKGFSLRIKLATAVPVDVIITK